MSIHAKLLIALVTIGALFVSTEAQAIVPIVMIDCVAELPEGELFYLGQTHTQEECDTWVASYIATFEFSNIRPSHYTPSDQ